MTTITANLTETEKTEKARLIGKFVTGTVTQEEKDRLNFLERKARNLL